MNADIQIPDSLPEAEALLSRLVAQRAATERGLPYATGRPTFEADRRLIDWYSGQIARVNASLLEMQQAAQVED